MSQRNSGYERKERDLYETPEWVTLAVKPYIPQGAVVWEPACASGKIANVLAEDHAVYGTDVVATWEHGVTNKDFLLQTDLPELWNGERSGPVKPSAIVTNPPFNRMAEKFIRHGIGLLQPVKGWMAMLLPVDFDSGKTRRDMFGMCGGYAGKLVLTSRIIWFERDDGTDNPSANHAWFLWDFSKKRQSPRIHYHYKD